MPATRPLAPVERRSYPSKYDAAKTLEPFSAQLRNETDLDAFSDDLGGAVRETMQPTHVSLWLHRARPRNGEGAEWNSFLTVSLY
jgi:hypothetical protein